MRKKLGNRKFASEPAKASCTTYGLCTEPQRLIVCFVLLPRLEKQRTLRPSRESDLWILSLQAEWHQPRSVCGAWLLEFWLWKQKHQISHPPALYYRIISYGGCQCKWHVWKRRKSPTTGTESPPRPSCRHHHGGQLSCLNADASRAFSHSMPFWL